MARQKGLGFLHVMQFIREGYGDAAVEKTLAQLSEDDRKTISSVVGVGWYDLALFARFLRAAKAACAPHDPRFLHSAGAFEVDMEMGKLLSLLIRVYSPQGIVEAAAKMWRRAQDTGTIAASTDGRTMTVTVHDWGLVDRALCDELAGYIRRLVEKTGEKQVSVTHNLCRSQGASDCVFDLRW